MAGTMTCASKWINYYVILRDRIHRDDFINREDMTIFRAFDFAGVGTSELAQRASAISSLLKSATGWNRHCKEPTVKPKWEDADGV